MLVIAGSSSIRLVPLVEEVYTGRNACAVSRTGVAFACLNFFAVNLDACYGNNICRTELCFAVNNFESVELTELIRSIKFALNNIVAVACDLNVCPCTVRAVPITVVYVEV